MRKCLFCDAKANSREDAWPLWLVERLPAPGGVRIEAQQGRRYLGTWRAVKHLTKVRFVCAPCNNGWMSRLENRAKPIITPLLDDNKAILDLTAQSTLAMWAIKSAMVFEALRGNTKLFYSAEDRVQMREGAVTVDRTNVWIARCVNFPGAYCCASDLSDSAAPSETETRGYVTTMVFGRLALQVMTLKVPHSVSADAAVTTQVRPGPWDRATLRIWPSQAEPLSWPTPLGLDGETGIETLRGRFKPQEP